MQTHDFIRASFDFKLTSSPTVSDCCETSIRSDVDDAAANVGMYRGRGWGQVGATVPAIGRASSGSVRVVPTMRAFANRASFTWRLEFTNGWAIVETRWFRRYSVRGESDRGAYVCVINRRSLCLLFTSRELRN